jgi:hypothetical protein
MAEFQQAKIASSICAIIGEMGAIGKTKKNVQQGFMYRGIDDVMNALQPLLAKHKVFVVPTVLEQFREDGTTKSGGVSHLSIFKIKYTFYADDGSFVEAVTVGEASDSGDKGSNKAMSIAFKYALFQTFCIPTEEMPDPDAETPPETVPKKSNVQPLRAPKTTVKELIGEITNLLYVEAPDGTRSEDARNVAIYHEMMAQFKKIHPDMVDCKQLSEEELKDVIAAMQEVEYPDCLK